MGSNKMNPYIEVGLVLISFLMIRSKNISWLLKRIIPVERSLYLYNVKFFFLLTTAIKCKIRLDKNIKD